jgi:peptide/nickel transport system substrate-binding protein
VAQLKAGQVDMIVRAPASDVPTLEKDPKLKIAKVDTVYVFYLELDMRDKPPQVSGKDGSPLAKNPFQDPKVREAVDLAIDRAALAEIAMEGLGKPVTQIVTSNIFGYDEKIAPVKPNVQRARQLMQEAGFPNGFKAVFNFTNDRLPGDRAVGTSVAQMLARIGLEVQANGQPGAVLFPARTRGDYSMVMSGWGTLTGEANYTLSSLAHSMAPQLKMGAFNWRNYNNPQVDKLLQDAAIEMDEAKRKSFLQQANSTFRNDRTLLPLAAVSSAWALQKDKVDLPKPRTDEDTLAHDLVPVKR